MNISHGHFHHKENFSKQRDCQGLRLSGITLRVLSLLLLHEAGRKVNSGVRGSRPGVP